MFQKVARKKDGYGATKKLFEKLILKRPNLVIMVDCGSTSNDAIEFLKYPKKINNDIYIHFGPHGYYMKYKGKNHTINQSGSYSEDYCMMIIRKS